MPSDKALNRTSPKRKSSWSARSTQGTYFKARRVVSHSSITARKISSGGSALCSLAIWICSEAVQFLGTGRGAQVVVDAHDASNKRRRAYLIIYLPSRLQTIRYPSWAHRPQPAPSPFSHVSARVPRPSESSRKLVRGTIEC